MSLQTVLVTFCVPGICGASLEPTEKIGSVNYYKQILWPIPVAAVIIVIRHVFERYVYTPMGILLGIEGSVRKKAVHNELLENVVRHRNTDIVGLAKQLDWSERQVERWLRVRRAQDRPTTLTKFTESGWRFTYYLSSFCFGLYVLWDKPWLWNSDLCWVDFPHQDIAPDILWYHLISLSFYWTLMVSQFTDVKRKDFWQMFAHHVITICLIHVTLTTNFTRVGSLILVIHDSADIFLESAKMAKYAKCQKVCDATFATFTIIWLATRTGLFPFVILHSLSIRAPVIAQTPMPLTYYILTSMLYLLLVLHLFWTFLIMKIVKSSLAAGQMDGDVRSSSSESDTSTHSGARKQA